MDEQTANIKRRLDMGRIPRHIAIIMDGNGRWAKQRLRPRSFGHHEGVASVRLVTEICAELGVEYLTLYAFSTENWNRPQDEVDMLMKLIGQSIRRETPDLIRNNVRLHLIGDIDRLPADARHDLFSCVEDTSGCTGLMLSLCLSYSSRWELTDAARRISRLVLEGSLRPEDITEETVARNLDTWPLPDPDLIIRTGGEQRLSNFLLWQAAYSELYFTDILWPDFGKEQLADAIVSFQGRERRYGLTSEQVENSPLPKN